MTVWQDYKKTLKPVVVEEWGDLLIYRPLGFIIAYPLSFTPITPNQVTLLATLTGVAGAVCVFFGTYEMMVWGALLYLFSNVLDCTDGQLARLTRTFSPFGRIFDGVADYIVGGAMFLAIALAAKPAGYTDLQWWALVLFGGVISTTYQVMHLNYVREAYLNAIHYGARSSDKEAVKEQENASTKRKFFLMPFVWLYTVYSWIEQGVRRRVRMPKNLTPESPRTFSLQLALVIWTFTGKGTHVTLLGIFLLMGKPEYYCWLTLIPMNLWITAAWLGHIRGLKSMSSRKFLSKRKG